MPATTCTSSDESPGDQVPGKTRVYIVLATFNGESFLESQIASIRNQTHTDWTLLIRDDGSTDRTPELLLRAAANDPRISIVPDDPGINKGVVDNFSLLLECAFRSGATVVFTCDQDDSWFPQKIECQLRRFYRAGMEPEPLLVHSDMELTDEHGGLLSPSFFAARGLNPEPAAPLDQLLSINYVTGCSIAINRRLMELAVPIPEGAVLHDWWLALVAAAVGRICYHGAPLLAYRQHGRNVVGASGEWRLVREMSRWCERWREGDAELMASFRQVDTLLGSRAVAELLTPRARQRLERYARLPAASRMERARDVRALQLRQGKLLLKLVLYARLLLPAGQAENQGHL